MSWGPSHQQPQHHVHWWRWIGIAYVVLLAVFSAHDTIDAWIFALGLLVGIVRTVRSITRRFPRLALSRLLRRLGSVRVSRGQAAERALGRGGVPLGRGRDGRVRFARLQAAVLVLGPPRSGKTSGIIIPSVLSHLGAVVSGSTKPDVDERDAEGAGPAGPGVAVRSDRHLPGTGGR